MPDSLNFTKLNLQSITPPVSGRVEYQDARIPALRLRVTENGVKTFCVYKRVKGGAPQRVTLGRFPDMSVEQAKIQATAILAEIAQGGNPASVKRAHRQEMTFSELFVHYLERHAKTHKKTHAEDQQRYDQYLARAFGGIKISSVSRQDIVNLHHTITQAGHPAVANRVLALVSSIFGRAIEWGILESNPCRGIRRNRENSRDRFLQSDELPRFFKALNEEPNEVARDFFLVCLLTGARRENVLTMQWSELNLKDGLWRIPDTKNGTPQTLPLPAEAIQLLKQRKKHASSDSNYVFPGAGSTGHLKEPYKAWKRILQRAGINNLRIHDLRRTLGSWQVKTGASLAIIGKSLNHKSVQTTAIYARTDLDPVRESIQKATSAMLDTAKKIPDKD